MFDRTSIFRRTRRLATAAAVLYSLTAYPQSKPKQYLAVRLEPEISNFASVQDVRFRLTIENKSNRTVAFSSCPTPYEIQVTDPHGNYITWPREIQNSRDLPICTRNFLTQIKSGESLSGPFTLHEMNPSDFALPGSYEVVVRYNFPWSLDENEYDPQHLYTLVTWSNRIRISIGR